MVVYNLSTLETGKWNLKLVDVLIYIMRPCFNSKRVEMIAPWHE